MASLWPTPSSYAERHNHANGEDNRDGHSDNHSWNNGAEGPSVDPAVNAARAADLRALLATLFASTGTIMLTAGDEFGRSQNGNNNAYAQDNSSCWVDWADRDLALEDYVAGLSRARQDRLGWCTEFPQSGRWLRSDLAPMTVADWEAPITDAVTCTVGEQHEIASLNISRSGRRATWEFAP